MPKNSLALCKLRRRIFRIFLIVVFSAAGNFLPAQEPSANTEEVRWYLSNSAGMTLGETPSRIAALRNEYCISIRSARYAELPANLLPYYDSSFTIELRTLYNQGSEIRHQWILRDRWGLARLNASGSGNLFAGRNSARAPEETAEEITSGFIEVRNSDGNITTEFQFEEDLSEWEYRYFYRGDILLRSEIWFKEAPAPVITPTPPAANNAETPEDEAEATENNATPNTAEENPPPAPPEEEEKPPPVLARLYTDYYRYTRSGSLRAIDRTLHSGALEKLRVGFPRLGPGAPSDESTAGQGSAYSSEFFVGAQTHEEGETITYNLDNRGRILGELWRDEEGAVVGELTNTWSGDRLQSVLWKTPDDERVIEFEYDREGNRIAERNFRRGVLERTVTNTDGVEIEELYINGKAVLRAYWENGIKISEERILSTGARQP